MRKHAPVLAATAALLVVCEHALIGESLWVALAATTAGAVVAYTTDHLRKHTPGQGVV